MKNLYFLMFVLIISGLISCSSDQYRTRQHVDSNGYKYETVTNDPFRARIYTLDNGLKVYLTIDKDEPRIQTLIAVRAGSNFDPPETTGLAHYFEHMMFKGTDEIGTIDWENERILIEKISDLYEAHRKTDDPEEKKNIYAKIDSISGIAAQYAVANEYDKINSSIGSKGLNAGTSNEYTVFMNNIPANQFEKWLKLEKERFSNPVLRLFHTELETVYEEFNMSQDNDNRKANRTLMSGLFQKHPLGTQTVLGDPIQLKNPSMENIMNYYNTYYCSNNMAFCLSGDFEFEETIKLIDKYWGSFRKNENIPSANSPQEDPIKQPIIKEVKGPKAEFLRLGFRFDGVNTPDEKYVTLIDNLLSNAQAGLIDLDLVQSQKVLSAGAYSNFYTDYGIHVFYGTTRQGQTLEEVKDLLLAEIEKIKKGEFDEWLIEAVINDMHLRAIKQQESNYKAFKFVNAFIKQVDWEESVQFINELSKITKKEIVDFANKHYKDNYVVVYKRTGKDNTVTKLEKPQITPIELNRAAESEFYKEFVSIQPEKLNPVFIDFSKEIKKENLAKGVDLNYIKNKTNELFSISYIIDMGKNNIRELPIAVNYLPYLGTDQYTPSELQQELFKLGLSMNVSTGEDRSYVTISGLDKSFGEGLKLLEHILDNVKPDQEIFDEYVQGILKKRQDNKLNNNVILWSAMLNYAKYGELSPFTNILTGKELLAMNPEFLTDILKGLYNYEHQVFYYGPRNEEDVKILLEKNQTIPETLKPHPPEFEYLEKPTDKNIVYFVDYDVVQAKIVMLSKDGEFNKDIIPESRLFQEYFGSNIVFQDIREARGLAYSAFASFSVPGEKEKSNYIFTYVATQADKLKDATSEFLEILNDMPKAPIQFEAAREAILTKIETERITKDDIFWTYLENKDRGIDYDIRKDVYDYVKKATLEEFANFFNEYISNKKYVYLILGNKNLLNMSAMRSLGEVRELSLEEIFGY